jgi:hypothetical protein
MGKRAFHRPAFAPESGSMPGAASGGDWLHAWVEGETAVLVVVAAAVGEHGVRAAVRSAALAGYGRNCFQQWGELRDAVAVTASQCHGKRDAGGVAPELNLARYIKDGAVTDVDNGE